MNIIIATNNQGKVKEIKKIYKTLGINFLSLRDFSKIKNISKNYYTKNPFNYNSNYSPVHTQFSLINHYLSRLSNIKILHFHSTLVIINKKCIILSDTIKSFPSKFLQCTINIIKAINLVSH